MMSAAQQKQPSIRSGWGRSYTVSLDGLAEKLCTPEEKPRQKYGSHRASTDPMLTFNSASILWTFPPTLSSPAVDAVFSLTFPSA